LISFNITNHLHESYKLYLQKLIKGCHNEVESNVRWRKAPNEAPHVLEGSGLAPVDGMGSFRYKNLSMKN
jgi:hypothetical protein